MINYSNISNWKCIKRNTVYSLNEKSSPWWTKRNPTKEMILIDLSREVKNIVIGISDLKVQNRKRIEAQQVLVTTLIMYKQIFNYKERLQKSLKFNSSTGVPFWNRSLSDSKNMLKAGSSWNKAYPLCKIQGGTISRLEDNRPSKNGSRQ